MNLHELIGTMIAVFLILYFLMLSIKGFTGIFYNLNEGDMYD